MKKTKKIVLVPTLRITNKYRAKKRPSIFSLFGAKKNMSIGDVIAKLRGSYSSKKLLGSGISGTTYAFSKVKPSFLQAIASMAQGYVVRGVPLDPHASVAVKFIKHGKYAFEEFDREVQILTYIQKKGDVVVGTRVYSASRHVPKLYMACHVPGLSIIVQSYAPGKTLSRYSSISARTIARLEYALLSLWLTGVAHTDLHSSNIMFDDVSGKLTIIDFGRAVILPPDAVKTMRRNVLELLNSSKGSLLEKPDILKLVSKHVVVDAVKRTHRAVGITKYYDDEAMIPYHIGRRCKKPTCSMASLAEERMGLWIPLTYTRKKMT
jgi:serine/threonine protein kinase